MSLSLTTRDEIDAGADGMACICGPVYSSVADPLAGMMICFTLDKVTAGGVKHFLSFNLSTQAMPRMSVSNTACQNCSMVVNGNPMSDWDVKVVGTPPDHGACLATDFAPVFSIISCNVIKPPPTWCTMVVFVFSNAKATQTAPARGACIWPSLLVIRIVLGGNFLLDS